MQKKLMYAHDPPFVESYLREWDINSDDLFKKHILYAIKIARQYYMVTGWMPGDVLQRAMMGLYDATKVWNPEKGAFMTIAYYYIHGRIKQLERTKADQRYKAAIPIDDLEVPGCHHAFDDILSDVEQVRNLLPFLTARERVVIELSFGLTMRGRFSLREIGEMKEFNLTRERIRQIRKRALKKMLTKGIK